MIYWKSTKVTEMKLFKIERKRLKFAAVGSSGSELEEQF